jgi:hypothetical protein
MHLSSVWTGKEMLVWGQGTRLAYNPARNSWRQLPGSRLLRVHDGFAAVVWTGKEMLGWGGGCCGDAFSDGVAFNPATNAWRALPKAPLRGDEEPVGLWTGQEYVVLTSSQGAAYNPARNTWRRIAAPPRRVETVVWNGTSVLVTTAARAAASFDPHTNRWHRLPSLPSGRSGSVAVWDGATCSSGAERAAVQACSSATRSGPVRAWAARPEAGADRGLDGELAARLGRRPDEDVGPRRRGRRVYTPPARRLR